MKKKMFKSIALLCFVFSIIGCKSMQNTSTDSDTIADENIEDMTQEIEQQRNENMYNF